VKAADRRGVQRRIRMVEIGLLGLLLLLALRAGHLSVIDRRGLERGLEQTGRELRLAPHRGLIVDRNGAELAVSLDAPSVYATPARVEDLRSTAEQLARALGLRAATVRDRLDRSSRFAFVARWVSPEQAEKVRDLELSGIGVIEEPRRVYPHRGLAAQVVGFANIDGRGVRGMEQQEHDWLSGTPLEVAVERDNRGQLLLPPGVDPGASSGGDVALTLDTVLQADAERTLEAAVRERGARGGLVVTLAPRTGEILALAERPGFDPNRFREVRYTATRSRAFLDALEPGSTLKAFLVAGALEAGAIRPDQQIDCGDGSLRIPGKTIRDRRAFGPLDPAGILRVSSNVGATRIAFDLGAESHFTALRRFGFGTSTGSGFPEESSGLLRPAARWRPVDHATIAYGQGVSVTAIQLAAATAALANGGVWQTPRLIAARRSPGQAWKPVSSGPSHRVVSAATARTVPRVAARGARRGQDGHGPEAGRRTLRYGPLPCLVRGCGARRRSRARHRGDARRGGRRQPDGWERGRPALRRGGCVPAAPARHRHGARGADRESRAARPLPRPASPRRRQPRRRAPSGRSRQRRRSPGARPPLPRSWPGATGSWCPTSGASRPKR
jgi:cell division protein FtsI (penicillin-binding protein 3)